MMTWFTLPCIAGVLTGIMVLSSKRKHLLNVLMSLEFISLNMLVLISTSLSSSSTTFFAMFFLVLVVCEGALGLGLLVSLVRASGNDTVSAIRLIYLRTHHLYSENVVFYLNYEG